MNGAAIECPEMIDEYADKITIKISDPIFSRPTEIDLHTGEKGLMFGNHTKYKYKIGKINKRLPSEGGNEQIKAHRGRRRDKRQSPGRC